MLSALQMLQERGRGAMLSDLARVDAAPERQLQAMLLPSPIRSDSLFQADRLDPTLRNFILLITILMAFPGLLRQEPTW